MIYALDSLWKDLHFALRQLWKRPGFSITAIAVLALGLGANAAIFSVVNAVLLQPLPFAHPEKLVALFEKDLIPTDAFNVVSPGNYRDWRRDTKTMKEIAAYREMSFNLASKSRSFAPERIEGVECSANLFSTLGVSPVIGRVFLDSEDKQNAPYVAIISYQLWKQRFAGSSTVLHRQIRLNENNYSIVGVMPKGLRYPNHKAQVWVALNRNHSAQELSAYSNHFLYVIGRLKEGYTAGQAQAEISAFLRHFHRDHPTELVGKNATVIPLNRYLVQDVRTSLFVLFGAVGCLLAIACVNIANLLLTRALGRQREMAIRAAVGATRVQLIRQLLLESMVISLLGALAGLFLASWAIPVLAAYAPSADHLPQIGNIRVNYTVLFFTIVLATVTGFVAGLFPSLSTLRTDLVKNLKEGGRANTAGRSHGRMRNVLIATEVAISLALLIAAGLLLRSFARLQEVQTGFRTENLITMGVTLPEAAYESRLAVANFSRALIEQVRKSHGLKSVGLVSYPPLAGHWSDEVFHIEGHPLPPGQMMDLTYRYADPGYFQAAGIPLIGGRLFTPKDNRGFDDQHPQMDPVLISASAARKFFGGLDPIGQHLAFGTDAGLTPINPSLPSPRLEIIGVVGDVLIDTAKPIEPTIYYPLLDGDSKDIYLVAHTAGDPQAVVSAITNSIHRLNPDLPVHDIRTLNQIAAESTADRRFSLVLLSLFAGLALLLAAVGLYGVVSYAVSQRTDEIGIRLALGASRFNVSRMILLQGMKPALAGIITGLIGAAALTRTLQSLLFDVGAMDPITFFIVPFVLLFVVVLACTIPAYRASRIDPMTALRAE